ncbi:acyl-CoA thioesterase [Streptomyces sp. NPDC004838]
MLGLEPAGADVWLGRPHDGRPPRAYGGAVLAQALLAAGRTLGSERRAHSLHAYFLRSVDPGGEPVEYRVDRLRDGASYAARQVSAHQHGHAVLSLQSSFKRPETERDRQPPAPSAPPPHRCFDPFAALAGEQPERYASYTLARAVDLRFVAPSPSEQAATRDELAEQRAWIRTARPLPKEPLVHEAALAYLSDLTLSPTAALPWEPHSSRRSGPPTVMLASLDHSVWFHRPPRADAWLLYRQRASRLADGRALTHGELWDQEGRLVATVAQEAVLRHRAPAG